MNDGYQERTYRRLVRGYLDPLRVSVQETDLNIYAKRIEPERVKESVIEQRGHIEGYIRRYPQFSRSLQPWPDDPLAPPIIQDMIQAGRLAGVGPMAAVAGAVAERVGHFILDHTDQVIVENGGDVFLNVSHPIVIGVYAGESPLSLKVGLKIDPIERSLSVCTSSGTVGHSKSYGNADAVCVVGSSCAQADAAATAIANHVHCPDDIGNAVKWGQSISGVMGLLVIAGEKMGMWGQVEITTLPSA